MLNISVANSTPNSDITGTIKELFKKAVTIRFSIAFLTKNGFPFVDDFLNYTILNSENSYGIVAVNNPTDIDRLGELYGKMPEHLFIHTGYKNYIIDERITPLMHTKLIVADYEDGTAKIYTGSHNWSGNALKGKNFESGVIIECDKQENIYKDIVEHIEYVKTKSKIFNPELIPFYKGVQKAIADRFGRIEKPDIDFHKEDVVVIISEIDDSGPPRKDETVYIEYDESLSNQFIADRSARIFCINSGKLHGNKEITLADLVTVLEGKITSANRTQFHPSNPDKYRNLPGPSKMIIDFNKPEIVPIDLDISRQPHCQGVIKVLAVEHELHIYHDGKNRPTFELDEITIKEPIETDNQSLFDYSEEYYEKIDSLSFLMKITTPFKGIYEPLLNDIIDTVDKEENTKEQDIPKIIRIQESSRTKYLYLSNYKIPIGRINELAREFMIE